MCERFLEAVLGLHEVVDVVTVILEGHPNSPEECRVACGVGLHDVSDSGQVVGVVDIHKIDGQGIIAEAG